jgi:hypothetical protein
MPFASIIIRQGDLNLTIGSRDDLVLNSVVTVFNNESPISSYLWQFIDKPANSAAVLTTPTQSIATFTPDVPGTYLIRLTINNNHAHFSQVGAAVKTTNLKYRIPAALEENEFDTLRGWASAVDYAFGVLDDGYGSLLTNINNAGNLSGSGASNQVAFWSGTHALTSNSNFTYNGTSATLGNVLYANGGIDRSTAAVLLLGTANANAITIGQAGGATGNISFNSNRIQSVADPTAAQDAATKNYVDSQIGNSISKASANNTQLTTTNPTTIATYTTIAQGNYMVLLYYRVITASTNLSIAVNWTDSSGAQTNTPVPISSQIVGSNNVNPFYFNATNGSTISISATAGTANHIFISADIIKLS